MTQLRFPEPILGTITFDEDAKQVIDKEVRDASTALGFVRDLSRRPDASKQALHSGLYTVESVLATLCKTMGVELDSAAEREARYADLRAANTRVRELEQQLGQSVAPQAIACGLKAYANSLRRWWREDGMGYVGDLSFGEWGGCEMRLSCSPGMRWVSSEKPDSDRKSREAWIKELATQGFSLTNDDPGHERIEDTPKARELLLAAIKLALPSSTVSKISTGCDRKGRFLLEDITIYVHDLEDVERLEQRTDSEQA